jgi:hypothetical protein
MTLLLLKLANVPIILYNNQATIRDFTNLKEGRTLKLDFSTEFHNMLQTRTIKGNVNHGLILSFMDLLIRQICL